MDEPHIENDTVRLLRECDAGVKMGVSAITEVMDKVKNQQFKRCLTDCKAEHDRLDERTQALLHQYHDEGKSPNPMAKGMSWMKTNVRMAVNESDEAISDLITDGCNMGVKSLSRFLNQYVAADEKSKEIAKALIHSEEKLAVDVRPYL